MPNLGVATLLSIVALENIFSIMVKRKICNRKICNGNCKDILQVTTHKKNLHYCYYRALMLYYFC